MRVAALFCLLISFASFSQKEECDCYKVYKGTFYSYHEDTGDTIIYERTKDMQIEYASDDPTDKHKLNIIWLDGCKYILRLYSQNPSKKEKIMSGDVICKIIATGEDYFTVDVWLKLKKKKKIFTMNIYTYPPGGEL